MFNIKTIIYTIINFLSLFIVNLKRNFIKEILLIIGILFSSLILILGLNFTANIQDILNEFLLKKIPINEIYITSEVKILDSGEKKISLITNELISKLKSWEEITHIEPVSKANFPSVIGIKSYYASSIKMEAPILGISEKLADELIDKTSETFPLYKEKFPNGFKVTNKKIPLLLPNLGSSIISNFFQNNSIQADNPIKLLQLFEYEIIFNSSILKALKEKVLILNPVIPVGFLEKDLQILGLFIPQDTLEKVKNTILTKKSHKNGYEIAILKIRSSEDITHIKSKLDTILKNYNLQIGEDSIFNKIANYIQNSFNILNISIYFFMFLILIISSITIFYGFSFFFEKRSYEIEIYKVLGASQTQIFSLLILESFLITLLAIFISYFLSFYFIENHISKALHSMIKSYGSLIEVKSDKIFENIIESQFKFRASKSFLLCLFIFIISNISSSLTLLRNIFKK